MNFFTFVFNVSTGISIFFMSFLAFITIYALIHERNPQKRMHLVISLVAELVILGLFYYILTHISSRTKSILGAFDLISLFF
jgi:uncharacterized BrkB/YihY/UPF0761 family membrane protein